MHTLGGGTSAPPPLPVAAEYLYMHSTYTSCLPVYGHDPDTKDPLSGVVLWRFRGPLAKMSRVRIALAESSAWPTSERSPVAGGWGLRAGEPHASGV